MTAAPTVNITASTTDVTADAVEPVEPVVPVQLEWPVLDTERNKLFPSLSVVLTLLESQRNVFVSA